MRGTGAELAVRALEDEGVAYVFGIPGTHTIELFDALADSAVRPVLVTDEQSAPFMADAVWRASGSLACVAVVPGAGLTHALSGIAEAFLDQAALVVLAAGVRNDTGHAYQLHDVDQRSIVGPVVKAALRVEDGSDLYATVRRACRVARTAPAGPVFVEVPANLYLFRHRADLDPEGFAVPEPPRPRADDVVRAAEVMGRARQPLLYLGQGASGAGEGLIALAERLQAPVATTFSGKGVFPESHPLFLWPGFGPSAPPFARAVAERCDATLAIGCRFGEVATGSYGLVPPPPLVHVDVDPKVLGRNHAAAVAVPGEAAAFVAELLPLLHARPEDPEQRDRIRRGHAELQRSFEAQRGRAGIAPARLFRALQRLFGPDTIFTTDSGNVTFLAVENLRLDRPGRLLAPVDYSCMGYAVPAAIGAKLARPEAPVVALPGDGALLMTGLELLTAASLRVPVVTVLLRDGELAQIAQFQQTALGRKVCSVLPDYDAPALARAVGVEALAMRTDDEVEDVLGQAAAVARGGAPVLVDALVDYSERTFFTRGVVRTNLGRLPWADRLRFVGRAASRRLSPREYSTAPGK